MTAKWKTLFGALVLVWLMIWASVWQESQVVARLTPAVVGAKISSPCPSGSNYLSAWNGDYTGDTDKICYNSKASTKDGTATGATLGTDYGRTGTGLLVTAAINQSLNWTSLSGNTVIDNSSTPTGTVCVDIYFNAASYSAVATCFWEATRGNVGDSVYLRVMGTTGYVRGTYYGGSAGEDVTTTVAVGQQIWATVKYTWSQPLSKHKVCVEASCVEEDSGDGDTLAEMTGGVINRMDLGEMYANSGSATEVWLDNMRIYSTYDATCE